VELNTLKVRMLGGFSIRLGGEEISDADNRSRKVWLLLAYILYCRSRTVPQEELMSLLWGEEEGSSNPNNALKTMFHRVRTALDQLGGGVGHTLIVRREGSYAWNNEISLSLDTEEFERLCRAGAAEPDAKKRLALDQAALELYAGDFLPKLSSEPWVVPISAYFHNLYVQTVLDAVSLLENSARWDEVAALCRRGVELEPYDENLYAHLMRSLLNLEDQKGAVAVYQNMSDLLFENFGTAPSDEVKALYRQAVHTINEREVNLGVVRDQLREDSGESGGALLCDYDFFKMIYRAEARSVSRSGSAVHIGLLSVGSEKGTLSKRSLDVCMDNLRDLICSSLRKGDIASRCSVSQYILMLPMANYENSCRVCERIVKAFTRQYPHSPAVLRYSVQPLEPNP
jgi:DNA-binding SARP family transcriptional activator